ncbi:MAG: histone deacetylase, partial [Cyclobacteriaceae bacterium]
MLKIAWSSIYAHELPENHRFPMEKYNLLPEQLVYEGTIDQENLFEPHVIDERYILNTHAKNYWLRLSELQLSKSEVRR